MNESEFFICSHCGFEVKISSAICKNCGSDDQTGWSSSADPFASSPPPEFDYQETLKNEFGTPNKKDMGMSWVSITGFILVFLLIYYLVR